MTITIQPSTETGMLRDTMVRKWTGASEKGVPVIAFIAYVGAEEGHDHSEFEELFPTEEPRFDVPDGPSIINSPLAEQAQALCQAIEQEPASEQQTDVAIMAGRLLHAICKLKMQ